MAMSLVAWSLVKPIGFQNQWLIFKIAFVIYLSGTFEGTYVWSVNSMCCHVLQAHFYLRILILSIQLGLYKIAVWLFLNSIQGDLAHTNITLLQKHKYITTGSCYFYISGHNVQRYIATLQHNGFKTGGLLSPFSENEQGWHIYVLYESWICMFPQSN